MALDYIEDFVSQVVGFVYTEIENEPNMHESEIEQITEADEVEEMHYSPNNKEVIIRIRYDRLEQAIPEHKLEGIDQELEEYIRSSLNESEDEKEIYTAKVMWSWKKEELRNKQLKKSDSAY